MLESYTTAYYRAAYEIRPRGEPIPSNGPVVVLRQNGQWTDEGKRLPPRERRALLQAHGEMRDERPVTGYDVFGKRRHVCACGAEFTGPPNRRGCDACRDKRVLLSRVEEALKEAADKGRL